MNEVCTLCDVTFECDERGKIRHALNSHGDVTRKTR
jgi:hypothetical protein